MVIPTTSIMSPPVLKVAHFLVRIKETCNTMNYDQLTIFCILSDKDGSKQIAVYTPLSTNFKRGKDIVFYKIIIFCCNIEKSS